MKRTVRAILPVDAGHICIADHDHYKPYTTEEEKGPTLSINMEPGLYKVKCKISAWLEVDVEKPLTVTSGDVWIGDSGYFVDNSKWDSYLEEVEYFEKMPEGTIALNTGGDGSFHSEFTFKRI